MNTNRPSFIDMTSLFDCDMFRAKVEVKEHYSPDTNLSWYRHDMAPQQFSKKLHYILHEFIYLPKSIYLNDSKLIKTYGPAQTPDPSYNVNLSPMILEEVGNTEFYDLYPLMHELSLFVLMLSYLDSGVYDNIQTWYEIESIVLLMGKPYLRTLYSFYNTKNYHQKWSANDFYYRRTKKGYIISYPELVSVSTESDYKPGLCDKLLDYISDYNRRSFFSCLSLLFNNRGYLLIEPISCHTYTDIVKELSTSYPLYIYFYLYLYFLCRVSLVKDKVYYS